MDPADTALAEALLRAFDRARDLLGRFDMIDLHIHYADAELHAGVHVAEGSESALDQVDVGALKQAVQGVDGDDNLKREIANNLDRAFDQLAPKQ